MNFSFAEFSVESVLKETGIGLWQIDTHRKTISFNEISLSILSSFSSNSVDLKEFEESLLPSFVPVFHHCVLDQETKARQACELGFKNGRFVQLRFSKSGGKKVSAGLLVDITETKEKEIATADKLEKLNRLNRLAKLGQWQIDYLERKITWSEELFKSFGMDPAVDKEPAIEDFYKLIHPEDVDVLKFYEASCTEAGIPYEVEIRQKQKDNSYKWVLVRGTPVHDGEGKLSGFIGINFDIDKRKKLDSEILETMSNLRNKEELLRSAYNSSISAIYIYDAFLDEKERCVDFVLVDLNNLAQQLVSIPTKDLIGARMSLATPGVKETGLFDHYLKVYETGVPFETEVPINLKRLNAQWVQTTCTRINRGIFISLRDITPRKNQELKLERALEAERKLNEDLALREEELKANEEELKQIVESQNELYKAIGEKEAKLSAIVNHSSDIILSINNNYLLQEFNPVFKALIHKEYNIWPRQEDNVKEQPYSKLLGPWESIQEALKGTHQLVSYEYNSTRQITYQFEAAYNPIVSEYGEILGLSVIIRDITVQKQNEFKIEELNHLLENILDSSLSCIMAFKAIRNPKKEVVDLEWLLANNKSVEFFGKQEAELKGKRFLQRFGGRELFDRFKHVIESGLPAHFEHLFSREGQDRWLEIVAVKLQNGLTVTFTDITTRRKAEDELKEQKALLETFINSLPFECWARDLEEKLILQNEVSVKQYGDHLGTKPQYTDFSPETIQRWKENNKRAYLGEVVSRETEYNIRGKTQYFHEIIAPIRVNGSVIGILGANMDISKNKEAEKALLVNEERLRLAMFTADIGIWEWDIRTDEVYWSDNIETLFNIKEGSFRKNFQHFLSLIHPDDLERVQRAIHTSVNKSGDDTYFIEHRIIDQKGNIGWMEGYGRVRRNREDEAVSLIGTVRNITSRKNAELILEENEFKFRLISRVSNDAMWDWDILNNRIQWSLGFAKIFGLPAHQEYAIEMWEASLHPEDKDRVVEKINHHINTPGLDEWEDEYRIVRIDGNLAHVIDKGQVIRDEKGTGIRMVGGMQDITQIREQQHTILQALEKEQILNEELASREQELIANEEELRQLNEQLTLNYKILEEKEILLRKSEEKFSKAFELSPDIISLIRVEDLRVIDVNKRLEELMGIERENIIGRLSTDFNIWFNEDDRADYFAQMKSKKSVEMQAKLRKSDNSFFYGEINARVIEFGDEKHVLSIIRDITDRIQKEEKLRENVIEMAEINKKMGEYKLMALKSAMNPHFIFNALNSIQYFVVKNDRKNAVNYLSFFSKLIRGVLNSSVKDKILLSDELELLKYYVQLELLRFENKFDVIYKIEQGLDIENIEIPGLLIQPFIENAILHGLYNKEDRGILELAMYERDNQLTIEIKDDGIGRAAASKIKEQTSPGHKSIGMLLTQERLEVLNKQQPVSIEIIDLEENYVPCGTLVKIYIKLT